MRFSALVFAFFTFAACSEEAPVLPLGEEKMAHILADVHLAEAAIRNATGADKDSLEQLYYKRIMEIHQISRQDYDSTLYLIQMNPDRIVRVYNRASTILDSLAQQLDED